VNHLPVDVFDGIGSLADQSLVQRAEGEGQARFIILATIREYALEVLEQLEASGQAGDVRRRHAEYYLALAVQGEAGQHGPEPRAWLSRLETEHDNLRAALEWAQRNDFKQALQLASALGWFWFARGYRVEGLQRLQSLVTRPEASGRTAARARALVELVALEQYSSAAAALADEAISIYQELDDKPGLALACHWRAITAYQAESRYELALNLFQEALTLFRQFGNHWGITRALSHMGIIHSVRGDYPGSRKLLEESLALCRESGDKRGSANVLVTLGTDAEQVGDLERARALLEESVALYREWGDSLSVTTPLCELGEALGRQGDYALAPQKVDEAYRLDQKSGEKQLAQA
jgi:tetratricopeptide (TPR) repeat protein